MKKLILLSFILSLFAACEPDVVFGQVFPKTSVAFKPKEVSNKPMAAFATFKVTTSKANIVTPLLPVGLVEARFDNGNIQTGSFFSAGGGMMWGITNITVFSDSTVLASGTFGAGFVVIYGQSSLTNSQSLIPAGVLDYDNFIFGVGADIKAKSNMARLVLSANLAAILPNSWTNITQK